MRSRSQKLPSESAKLKLRQYRFKKDEVKAPERKQYTPEQIKKLFKNWR
jgi:hypothetical protein